MPDVNLLLACVRKDISACNFVLLVETNAAKVIFHLVNNYFECKRYIEVDADRSLVGVPKEMIPLNGKLVD